MAPVSRNRCSSLRRFFSPPRLVCATKVPNDDATLDGRVECFRNLGTVEAEDHQIDFFFCLTNSRKEFRPTVARLHDEFHG